jgi:hypothetical protein
MGGRIARPGHAVANLPPQILPLGPTPPWPGVRRGMLKDKSKFSRFIHLMGMHLMGVHLIGVYIMSMHLIRVHLINLCLIPLGGKCEPPRLTYGRLQGALIFDVVLP